MPYRKFFGGIEEPCSGVIGGLRSPVVGLLEGGSLVSGVNGGQSGAPYGEV